MSRVSAVISDFGGVLTSPLLAAFAVYSEHSGVSGRDFGRAMALAAEASGEPPLFALERGQLSERDFLARLEDALHELLGRRVDLAQMGERLMGALRPNEELFAYYRRLLDERGIRLGILTNNVREHARRALPRHAAGDRRARGAARLSAPAQPSAGRHRSHQRRR